MMNRKRTEKKDKLFDALVDQAAIALADGSAFQLRIGERVKDLDVVKFALAIESMVGFPVRVSGSYQFVTVYRDDEEFVDSSFVVADVSIRKNADT